ncbi:hypothetical protein LXL04_025066 [Taraxacum kok-saghyz]
MRFGVGDVPFRLLGVVMNTELNRYKVKPSCCCWIQLELKREMIFGFDQLSLPNGGFRTRWYPFVPIKVPIFGWRVFLDRLLMSHWNLSRKWMEVPLLLCLICSFAINNIDHLLVFCELVVDLWRKVSKWIDKPVVEWTQV